MNDICQCTLTSVVQKGAAVSACRALAGYGVLAALLSGCVAWGDGQAGLGGHVQTQLSLAFVTSQAARRVIQIYSLIHSKTR